MIRASVDCRTLVAIDCAMAHPYFQNGANGGARSDVQTLMLVASELAELLRQSHQLLPEREVHHDRLTPIAIDKLESLGER